MSPYRRRIFWGHSLAQALAKASRYHGAPAERLAYRVHEKRHGFVRHPRAVLIEVDPDHPLLPEGVVAAAAPAREKARPALPQGGERAPSTGGGPRGAGRRRGRPENEGRDEPWDDPDEESIYAAAEAARRLLQLAGLDLSARVEAREGRLELELSGSDEARLRALGIAFLDQIEVLLPRAVMGLSGRHVRCRVEGASLRAAREEELRARAREVAARVRATGSEEALEPLHPAERRIVHLELRDQPGVRTESLGQGFLKRVRVSPA